MGRTRQVARRGIEYPAPCATHPGPEALAKTECDPVSGHCGLEPPAASRSHLLSVSRSDLVRPGAAVRSGSRPMALALGIRSAHASGGGDRRKAARDWAGKGDCLRIALVRYPRQSLSGAAESGRSDALSSSVEPILPLWTEPALVQPGQLAPGAFDETVARPIALDRHKKPLQDRWRSLLAISPRCQLSPARARSRRRRRSARDPYPIVRGHQRL